MPRREITQIVSSRYIERISSRVSTRVHSTKETKSFVATVLKSFILFCKHLGTLKKLGRFYFRTLFLSEIKIFLFLFASNLYNYIIHVV